MKIMPARTASADASLRRLKTLVADLTLDNQMIKAVVQRK
jgi:hypothetical protein